MNNSYIRLLMTVFLWLPACSLLAETVPVEDGKALLELPDDTGQLTFTLQHTNGNIQIVEHPKNSIRVDATQSTFKWDPGHLSWDESKQKVHLDLGIHPEPIDVRIWLPQNCVIDLQAINSDISISDAGAEIIVKLVNGNIQLDNVSGTILVETVNGETRLTPSAASSDKVISIASQNGDIHLDIPKGLKGSAKVTSIGGHVYCNVPTKDDSDALPLKFNLGPMKRQTIPINGGGRPININTVSGDIHIRVK